MGTKKKSGDLLKTCKVYFINQLILETEIPDLFSQNTVWKKLDIFKKNQFVRETRARIVILQVMDR